MPNEIPRIKIPETNTFVTETEKFKKEATEKFRNFDLIIYTVVISLIIISISSLIAVSAIIIDQLHFNNVTYREYQNNCGNPSVSNNPSSTQK